MAKTQADAVKTSLVARPAACTSYVSYVWLVVRSLAWWDAESRPQPDCGKRAPVSLEPGSGWPFSRGQDSASREPNMPTVTQQVEPTEITFWSKHVIDDVFSSDA
jgi:hypothetical protein